MSINIYVLLFIAYKNPLLYNKVEIFHGILLVWFGISGDIIPYSSMRRIINFCNSVQVSWNVNRPRAKKQVFVWSLKPLNSQCPLDSSLGPLFWMFFHVLFKSTFWGKTYHWWNNLSSERWSNFFKLRGLRSALMSSHSFDMIEEEHPAHQGN